MRNLTGMSATQLLDWLRARPVPTDQLVVFYAAGFTDLHLLYNYADQLAGEAGGELKLLTDSGGRVIDEPLAEEDIDRIAKVGHQVYLRNRANVTDWASIAELIERSDRTGWKPRLDRHSTRWEGNSPTRQFFTALLDAGRAPAYARELVEAAVKQHVAPDTYYFGQGIAQAVFTELAQAGVGGPELDLLLAERISLEDAIEFTRYGCPAGALIAAKRQGIVYRRWRWWTRGMNPDWFPLYDTDETRPRDPIQQGALGKYGFSWQQLRDLVDNGWAEIGLYNLTDIWVAGRGNRVTLTPAEAVQIAKAGVAHEELQRWLGPLTHPSESGPLVGKDMPATMDRVNLVIELRGLGVTPSSLVDYRHCGCVTIEDIRTAAQAGVNAARVKHLRQVHGVPVRYGRTKRIDGLAALLNHHRQDTARDRRA
jgi:hypothetical protein